MGGTSRQTQNERRTTTPFEPFDQPLRGIASGLAGINPNLTGNQSGALDQITNYARNFGNQFQGGINYAVNAAFAGGGLDRSNIPLDAYNALQNNLAGTVHGDYLDPNRNPFFGRTTQALGNDITNRIRGQFAAAGRDFSGAETGTISRELGNALAPVYGAIYGQERGNQLNAQNALFGAGGTTAGLLAGLDQQRFGNQAQGIGMATQAQNAAISPWNAILQAEAQRSGIPLGILSQLSGIAGPLGAQFGTTNTNTQGTNQMSGAQQFATIMSGLGQLMPRGPVSGNSITF